jgi:hypothetical protein
MGIGGIYGFIGRTVGPGPGMGAVCGDKIRQEEPGDHE